MINLFVHSEHNLITAYNKKLKEEYHTCSKESIIIHLIFLFVLIALFYILMHPIAQSSGQLKNKEKLH